MEELLSVFFSFHFDRHKKTAVINSIILGLVLIVIIGLLWIPDYELCWNTLWNIHLNLVASLIAFGIAFTVLIVISRSLQRYEDEFKVSYRNSKMHLQYGKKSEYHKQFRLGDDPTKAEFVVYVNDLFLAKDTFNLVIHDEPNKLFEVDPAIKVFAPQLLNAHATSKKVNELTPRLENFEVTGDNKTIILTISRSTYLNHMLTNRAMDYALAPHATLRELYENTKELSHLPESKMSNHLGINALIFLQGENGKKILVLPKRGKDATVVKNGVTASIAARLELGHYEAAKQKGEEQLKQFILGDCCIKSIKASSFALSKQGIEQMKEALKGHITFLGLARDPYEGGKPTLFYYIELSQTPEDFEKWQDVHYKRDGVDAAEQVLFAEWDSLQMANIKPRNISAEEAKEEDKVDDKSYDQAMLSATILRKGRKPKTGLFTFEQNLIANLWFYDSFMKAKAKKNKK